MGCGASAKPNKPPDPPADQATTKTDRSEDKKAAQLENKETDLGWVLPGSPFGRRFEPTFRLHIAGDVRSTDNESDMSRFGIEAEYEARMRFLDQVPLMKRLPRDERPIVAEACEACEFQNGDVTRRTGSGWEWPELMLRGDPGDAFYVIRSGEARVFVQTGEGQDQATWPDRKGGDYFGENALLRDEPRTATIIASSRLLAFRILGEAGIWLGCLGDLPSFTTQCLTTEDKKREVPGLLGTCVELTVVTGGFWSQLAQRVAQQELGLNAKLQFANRKAVGAGMKAMVP
eukprot:Skav207510  [mRNA]  locus=scaffold907:5896:9076:- [translate_table: standard]